MLNAIQDKQENQVLTIEYYLYNSQRKMQEKHRKNMFLNFSFDVLNSAS
jgi:hypothetical protein